MDYTENSAVDENANVDLPPKTQNESSKAASPAEASSSQNNEQNQLQKQQPSKEELEKKITEMKKLIDSQRKLQSDIMRDLDSQKHQIDLNSNEKKPEANNQTKNEGSSEEQGQQPLSSNNQMDESSEIREDQAIETPIGASQLFNESPLADDYEEVPVCDALPNQSEHVPVQN